MTVKKLLIPLLTVPAIVIGLAARGGAPPAKPAVSAGGAVPPANGASSAAASGTDGLKRTLAKLLAETTKQESGKDATCWTTVRMMDAHFAGREVPDTVALIKIEACKTLVYDVWRKASAHAAPGAALGAEAIAAALPLAMRDTADLMVAVEPRFGADPLRSVMNRDYHRITENKRYLLSIIGEAIEGVGLFERRAVDIAPLSDPAIAYLAAAGTLITTDFLADCGRRAAAAQHATIAAEDVRASFAGELAALGLDGTAPDAAAAGSAPPPDPDLLAATRGVIAGKIAALRAWNGAVWKDATDPEQRQMELVNRMTKIPFERASFAALERRLVRYVDYLARGLAPQQRNTFYTPVNGQVLHLPPAESERRTFIELPWAANALENLFPRAIAANGDVTAEIIANPGVPAARDRHESLRLLDWELDALRDTTLHWTLIETAWRSPEARPADPFALEMLADRMSELALLFIRTADEAAVRQLRPAITEKICDNMLMDVQFAVPERPHDGWSAADLARKATVLAAHPGPFFADIGAESGLPAVGAVKREGFAGADEKKQVRSITLSGAGVAVGDFDGDGLPDLFLAGDGGNRLLRNLGGRRFEDVTAALGIDDPNLADAHHPLFVDYDNDGRLDLLVVHSDSPSRLFHQGPDGRFTDAGPACGLVTGLGAHDAVFFDYDDDGLLDCYVGHYGQINPSLDGRNGGRNLLFHNLGGGHFEDVTDRAGVGSTGWTLATAAIDVDHDGRMDLFVANDYGRSELFINQGDGTFVERGHELGVDDRGSSMNASVIDIDDDGWMDLYVTQIDMFSKSIGWVFPQGDSQIGINQRILRSTFSISGNKLFRNDHGKAFASIDERLFEPGDRGWSWSGNFFDYDDDGDDDLYLTNGWVADTPAADQANQLFIRDGDRFYLAPASDPACYRGNSRGAVAADLTGSGRVDLVVNDYGARPRLLANACANHAHWLKVRLHGTRANRLGIGAVVRLARGDGRISSRQINCGANYLSQDETTPTFGLGESGVANAITVVWPGGHEQVVAGPFKPDTTVEITEDQPPRRR